MSWSPADDYDDYGRYRPHPYPNRRGHSFANCAPGCCRNGLRLCEEPRDDDDDLYEEDDE